MNTTISNEDKKKIDSYTHINPNYGQLSVNRMSPVVKMKKIKLQGSGKGSGLVYLPEVEEEDEVSLQENPKEDITSKPIGYELSLIHTMNKEERNAHIQKCLEMSFENKITPKNAFALQLIDCMSILVEEKKDFPTMACTLDASAKIYSSRVDALHNQVTKLADEVILNMKHKTVSSKDVNEDDYFTSKEKRRARKKGIIVSSESLQRKFKGKDPRSRFVKFEGLPGSITNRVRRDPIDLSYSLENNLPIWKNWDEYTPNRVGGTVKLSLNIKLIREDINADKAELKSAIETVQEHCVSNLVEEDPAPSSDGDVPAMDDLLSMDNDIPAMDDNLPATDDDLPTMDDDLPAMDDDGYIQEEAQAKVDGEKNLEVKEVGVVETVLKRLSQSLGSANENNSSRLEALKILFKESSEYHYLDMKNVQYWAGPEFWKRSKARTQLENKKTFKKKKEHAEIVYDLSESMVETKWNSLFNKKNILKNKTVKSWKNNKLTLPQDLKIEINSFFELFNILNFDGPEGLSQTSSELNVSIRKDDIINIEQDIINNTSHYDDVQNLSLSSTNSDPLNSSFYEGVPGQSQEPDKSDDLNSAFYDVGIISQVTNTAGSTKDLGRVIGVQVYTNGGSSFDESTLIPAPKIVSFEPIKYSIRPIQVDMKHLKETMLTVIHEAITRDMEVKMATPGSSASAPIPETRFSHILEVLPSKLRQPTARNMSIAMAFLALLTVTNENNLQLEDTSDSDVIIRLEC